MAIKPIEGFYVHDEETNTDGVAKVSIAAVQEFEDDIRDETANWLENNPDIWSPVPDDSLTTDKYKDESVTGEKLSDDLHKKVIDNIHEKPLLYGDGNTACLIVNSNYPNVEAGVAASDIVMMADNFTTKQAGEYYGGKFVHVTATTATTATFSENVSNYAIPNMWVWLYTQLPTLGRNHAYFGIIQSVNGDTITVTEWRTHTGGYDRPTSGTVATPTGVLYAVINPVNKLYAHHGYYRLLKPENTDGAMWTSELIAYQSELYADTPGTLFGYDVAMRQNDANASSYAFRARANAGKWTQVLRVEGDADTLIWHDGVTVLDGNGSIGTPYVRFSNEADATGSPVILTNGESVNLSTIASKLKTSAKFTLVNNSGARETITVDSNHHIRFGGSPNTVNSFQMNPQEVLDVIIPYGGSNFWVYGVREFCPSDTWEIYTTWYPLAMNVQNASYVTIPLPYGHRTCTGATITGSAAVRQNGTNLTGVANLSDTSVFNNVGVTLSNGTAIIRIGLQASGQTNNDTGIVYLQSCTLTFT